MYTATALTQDSYSLLGATELTMRSQIMLLLQGITDVAKEYPDLTSRLLREGHKFFSDKLLTSRLIMVRIQFIVPLMANVRITKFKFS